MSRKFLIGLILCIGIIGCAAAEKNPSGIWGLHGSYVMDKFLGIKEEGQGYAIDFRPKEGKALIRFMHSDKMYEVKIEKLGKYHYRMYNGEKSREFIVREFDGRPVLWNFFDSTPYNPKEPGERDGDFMEPEYKTLDAMVAEMELVEKRGW